MPIALPHLPLAPPARVQALSVLLAFVGAAGVIPLVTNARIELPLLALPIALGLLTRSEFWRKAALVYAVLNAAVEGGVFAFLLRILASQPAATATGALAPRDPSGLPNIAAMVTLIFSFIILSQPEVRALFRPFRAAPGA